MISQNATNDPQTTNSNPPPEQCYKRYKRENDLSAEQRLAIHLLLQGHPDQHVADTVGVHRTTITRWRLYHPTFQTELNRVRQAHFLNNTDRLRAMMSAALDTLQSHLASSSERASFRAAISILRLVYRAAQPTGPTDEYDLLKQLLLREHRERDSYSTQGYDWPIPKDHLDSLRQYLIQKSTNTPLDDPLSSPLTPLSLNPEP